MDTKSFHAIAATMALLVACGGGNDTPPADTLQESSPSTLLETAESPTESATSITPNVSTASAPAIIEASLDAQPETTEPVTPSDSASENIMIVLDSSGSMWGQIEGEPKRDIARKALREMLPNLPTNAQIGLVAYGHRKKGDCSDIETLMTPAPKAQTAIADRADGLKSLGKTPLTAAVKQAADALSIEENKSTVILITDGIETCSADPCALGKSLESSGVDFTAHVIGFGLTSKEGQQVSCLAEETGGLYIEASNAGDLGEALNVVTDDIQLTEVPDEEPEALGEATVTIPVPTVVAGSAFGVEWTGPENSLDGLRVRSTDGKIKYAHVYVYLDTVASPTDIRAPEEVGEYDVHYETRNGISLAKARFAVTEATATLDAPDDPIIGNTRFTVEFTGPMNQFDQIAIMDPAADNDTLDLFYVESDSRNLMAPANAGTYVVQYRTRENRTLAKDTITVVEPDAWVKGPGKPVIAGAKFEITVSGNAGEYDKIRIVNPADAKSKNDYAFVKHAKKTVIRMSAPTVAGDYVLEYTNRDDKVLASDSLTITAVEAWIKPPSDVIVAGAKFPVEVSTVGGEFDQVVIVDPDPDKKHIDLAFTQHAKNGVVNLMAPNAEGTYAVHYINQDKEVLATGEMTVILPDATMDIPSRAVTAGERFVIGVSKNYGEFDRIIIPNPDNPKKELDVAYVKNAKDGVVNLTAPKAHGTYDVHYINRDKLVLSTGKVRVK